IDRLEFQSQVGRLGQLHELQEFPRLLLVGDIALIPAAELGFVLSPFVPRLLTEVATERQTWTRTSEDAHPLRRRTAGPGALKPLINARPFLRAPRDPGPESLGSGCCRGPGAVICQAARVKHTSKGRPTGRFRLNLKRFGQDVPRRRVLRDR